MEAFLNRENAFTRIKPLFYLCKIIGLAPVTPIYTQNQGKRQEVDFKTSCIGISYTILIILITITASVSSILDLTHEINCIFNVKIFALILLKNLLSVVSGVVTVIYSATIIWKKLAKVFKLLALVDDEFSMPSITLHNSNSRPILIVSTSGVIILTMVSFSYGLIFKYSVLQNVKTFFALCIPYMVSFSISLLFCYINLTIKQRFECISFDLDIIYKETVEYRHGNILFHPRIVVFETIRDIQSRNHQESLTNNQGEHPKSFFLIFRKLREIHDMLCDTITLVISIFGLQIFLVMFNSLFGLTSDIYAVSSIFQKKQNYNVLIPYLVWIVLFLFHNIFIISSASMVSHHAGKIIIPLQKFTLFENLCYQTLFEVQLFIQQVLTRRVKFNILGLFTLDHTLIWSLLSLILTYFIVLVQLT